MRMQIAWHFKKKIVLSGRVQNINQPETCLAGYPWHITTKHEKTNGWGRCILKILNAKPCDYVFVFNGTTLFMEDVSARWNK